MTTASPLPSDRVFAVIDDSETPEEIAAVVEARARIARGETTSRDRVLAALDRAPLGEPFPPEVRAELDRRMADLRSGRVKAIPHADVQRSLEEMHERAG